MSILSLFGETTTYYTTTQSSDLSDAAAAGIATVVILFSLLFVVLAYAAWAYCLGRIFKKAGVESWKAWVPVYNSWILLELGDQQGFWAVLAFVPLVNIASMVFMYIAHYNIGLKLGKEGAFVLLAIFLPIVWVIWLAFDSSVWKGAPKVAAQPTPAAPKVE